MSDEIAGTVRTVRFVYDPDRVRLIPQRGKIALQALRRHSKNTEIRGVLAFLATFMTDQNDEYLDREDAEDILGDMNDDQLVHAMTAFLEVIQDHAVPKPTRRKSAKR